MFSWGWLLVITFTLTFIGGVILMSRNTPTDNTPTDNTPTDNTPTDKDVDCVMAMDRWFPLWSKCSKACGDGISTRSRIITTKPSGKGKKCPTEVCSVASFDSFNNEKLDNVPSECAAISMKCNNECDCKLSKWSDWSECSRPCGSSGLQQRTRAVIADTKPGGTCPPLSESRECNRTPCNRYGTECAMCASKTGCTDLEITQNTVDNCDVTTGICKDVNGEDALGCLPTGLDVNEMCAKVHGAGAKAVYNKWIGGQKDGNSMDAWSCARKETPISNQDIQADMNNYCMNNPSLGSTSNTRKVNGVKKSCSNDGVSGQSSTWRNSDTEGNLIYVNGYSFNGGYHHNGVSVDKPPWPVSGHDAMAKYSYNQWSWDCLYPNTDKCSGDCKSSSPSCAGKLRNHKNSSEDLPFPPE